MPIQNPENAESNAKGSQQSANHGNDSSAGDTAHQQVGGAFSGSGQDGQVESNTEGSGERGDAMGSGQQFSQHTSQQQGMPPSQTDDEQYDQGTVKRAP